MGIVMLAAVLAIPASREINAMHEKKVEICNVDPANAPCDISCFDDPTFVDANGNDCHQWAKWSNPALAKQREAAGTHIQIYPCRNGYKKGASPLASVPACASLLSYIA